MTALNNNSLNISNYNNSKTGDNISQLVSFLDIPFFFNNRLGSFYRFEASIYNYTDEPVLKNTLLH